MVVLQRQQVQHSNLSSSFSSDSPPNCPNSYNIATRNDAVSKSGLLFESILLGRSKLGTHDNVSSAVWSFTQRRNHWRPVRSLRTPFTKPLNFDYSGDLDLSVGEVDMKSPKPGYENVPELLTADENVRRIFSLEYATHADVMKKRVDEVLRKVQEHPLDVRSLEVKIAKSTVNIRNSITYCLQSRNNKVAKGKLIELIHKRRGYLRLLMLHDIDKFNWIQEQLRIRFVEAPETYERPTKAGLRRKAASDAALAAIEEKKRKLREMLAAERANFEAHKEAELADIEKGLRELGVADEDMSSLQKTLEALGHGDLYPVAKPRISRKRQILLRKFELYMPRKKERDAEILHVHGFYSPDEMPHYPDTTRQE